MTDEPIGTILNLLPPNGFNSEAPSDVLALRRASCIFEGSQVRDFIGGIYVVSPKGSQPTFLQIRAYPFPREFIHLLQPTAAAAANDPRSTDADPIAGPPPISSKGHQKAMMNQSSHWPSFPPSPPPRPWPFSPVLASSPLCVCHWTQSAFSCGHGTSGSGPLIAPTFFPPTPQPAGAIAFPIEMTTKIDIDYSLGGGGGGRDGMQKRRRRALGCWGWYAMDGKRRRRTFFSTTKHTQTQTHPPSCQIAKNKWAVEIGGSSPDPAVGSVSRIRGMYGPFGQNPPLNCLWEPTFPHVNCCCWWCGILPNLAIHTAAEPGQATAHSTPGNGANPMALMKWNHKRHASRGGHPSLQQSIFPLETEFPPNPI